MIRTFARPLTRRGLTLVEMLVATTLTLILFFSVAQIFAFLGDTMHDARSTIELSGNLRGLTTTMQTDLDCHTAPGLPWLPVGANQGYFTVIEGPDRDRDFATVASVAGDADDIIAFTAYSKDQPFVGLVNGSLIKFDTNNDGKADVLCIDNSSTVSPITSHYAEIIYWTEFTDFDDTDGDGLRDADESVTLFRRVLLIRPDIDFLHVNGSWDTATSSWNWTATRAVSQLEVSNNFDLSLSPTSYPGVGGDWNWKTNSLEDLQSRQVRTGNRMIGSIQATSPYEGGLGLGGQSSTSFPNAVNPAFLRSFEKLAKVYQSEIDAGNSVAGLSFRDRTGEDVIMAKVLAFDVKVFDPLAPILVHSTANDIAAIPGDVGFDSMDTTAGSSTNAGTGAYVDLNWSNMVTGGVGTPKFYDLAHFFAAPSTKSQMSGQTVTIVAGARSPSVASTRDLAVYDTWPMLYEQDGLNQDGDALTDEGTNGIDDDGVNGVDDPGERETAPPYDRPLRGIQITIRAIEDGSRLIRQDTVTANLMTE